MNFCFLFFCNRIATEFIILYIYYDLYIYAILRRKARWIIWTFIYFILIFSSTCHIYVYIFQYIYILMSDNHMKICQSILYEFQHVNKNIYKYKCIFISHVLLKLKWLNFSSITVLDIYIFHVWSSRPSITLV